MNRTISLVAGLAVLALAVSSAMCADAPTSKPTEFKLGPYYAPMAAELKLDDATKAKIAEKVKAIEAFNKENKPKIEEANKALTAARDAKDEAAATKASQDVKALELAGRKFAAGKRIEINALLTDDQRQNWEAIQMVQNVQKRVDGLTDAQVAKIRDLAKGLSKDMAAARATMLKASAEATADTKIDEKPIREINMKFMTAVKDQVLTDAQKAALEEKPTSKPAGDAKSAPKAAEPKK